MSKINTKFETKAGYKTNEKKARAAETWGCSYKKWKAIEPKLLAVNCREA